MITGYQDLSEHVGHKVEINKNEDCVYINCVTCDLKLIEFETPNDDPAANGFSCFG